MRKQSIWRNAVSAGLVFAAGFGCIQTQACEPTAVVEAYIAANYEQALKLNEDCIEHNKEKSSGSDGWYHESLYHYHFAVRSQIASEMGRFQESEDLLNQAKSYFLVTNPALIAWTEFIDLTEGFYLEKTGRTYDAESFYVQHQGENTLARLAVLAMRRGDMTAAADWAARSLQHNPKNLTSRIVLASISSSGSMSLVKDLHNLRQKGNQFQPAYYAEVWWATLWMQEAGRIGAFPVFD